MTTSPGALERTPNANSMEEKGVPLTNSLNWFIYGIAQSIFRLRKSCSSKNMTPCKKIDLINICFLYFLANSNIPMSTQRLSRILIGICNISTLEFSIIFNASFGV